jgi:histidinol-phosphate/aromatic aminotransferase/cobyric acid decarboxylase-like protein/SAM-dependent methyltransferase
VDLYYGTIYAIRQEERAEGAAAACDDGDVIAPKSGLGVSGMSKPWYVSYFTPDYWSFAAHEYSPERTEREVAYLASCLRDLAPGRQVLDLCCGVGRHAIGLARLGFEVVAVDVSGWALEQAASSAREAGVQVAWRRMDLLRDPVQSLPRVDAVVCLQAYGMGSDADQMAMLRAARDRLVSGGLLILDHSNVTAILRAYTSEARFEADGVVYEFERNYDLLSGHSRGLIRVSHPDGSVAELPDDFRLYQSSEVSAALRAAGFDVVRVDADFSAGENPQLDTRYVQFLARRAGLAAPASPFTLYEGAPPASDDLDLRWSLDEIEFVRPAVDLAWEGIAPTMVEQARRYPVEDPFGANQGAPSLTEHFGWEVNATSVTFGSGTTGLLHGLAALAAEGDVCTNPFGHPNLLLTWAHRNGARLWPADPVEDLDGALAAIIEHRPNLVLTDRPDIRGMLCDWNAIRSVASAAAAVGGLVVVDEAQASYLGPAASSAPLVHELDNLVVLRSVSKGYCCGGLRVGYAVGAPRATALLRTVALPMAASSLAFEVGLRLLAQADVFASLRERIAQVKPLVMRAMSDAGLQVEAGHPHLPWVTVTGHAAASSVLGPRKILAKRLSFELPQGRQRELVKVAVPLSMERERRFREAFASPPAAPLVPAS